MLDPEVSVKIIELTKKNTHNISKSAYAEILREMLNLFGSLYCPDSNGNLVRIKCSTGRQDRAVGKENLGNNMVLPFITVSELTSVNADSRRRYNPVLVHEKTWNPETMRATRVLSLPPRPIDMTYQVNIWTRWMEDMDIIRHAIFSLFNPSLDIKTSFSDYTKAFISSEGDIEAPDANDTTDKVLKRTITIDVETYIPSPKFLYTSTGDIETINIDTTLT